VILFFFFLILKAMSSNTKANSSAKAEFSVSGETLQFGNNEKNVLEYWRQINAFETSNKLSKDRPRWFIAFVWKKENIFCRYTFYDGPPFATGLPHYGHILAGTIKDTVTRWAYQTGHHVERRFGWGNFIFFALDFHRFCVLFRLSWSPSCMLLCFHFYFRFMNENI